MMSKDEYLAYVREKLEEAEREARKPDAVWYTQEEIFEMAEKKLKEIIEEKNGRKPALRT